MSHRTFEITCTVCQKSFIKEVLFGTEETVICPYCGARRKIKFDTFAGAGYRNIKSSRKRSTTGDKQKENTTEENTTSNNSGQQKPFSTNIGCLALVVILITFLLSQCTPLDSDDEYAEKDEVWSSQDYGDDYYYDSGSHSVQKSLHGILFGDD